MKNGKFDRSIRVIFLIVIAVLIIPTAAKSVMKSNRRGHFKSVCEQYPEVLSRGMPQWFKSFPGYQDVEVNALSIVKADSPDGGNVWFDKYNVTVVVDTSFDDLSAQKQFSQLEQVKKIADQAREEILAKDLPEYDELDQYEYEKAFERNGKLLRSSWEHRYFIKSGYNLYEYLGLDLFNKNGNLVDAQTYSRESSASSSNSPSPSPARTTPSAGTARAGNKKSHSTDPYDVDQYNDPEDFWEENEDDFDDFEDAWDYWEEHQE